MSDVHISPHDLLTNESVRHLLPLLRHPPLLRKPRLVVCVLEKTHTHFILRRTKRRMRRRTPRMPRLNLVVVSLLVLVTSSSPSPRLRLLQLLRSMSTPLRSVSMLPFRPSTMSRKLRERQPPLKLKLPNPLNLLPQ